MIFDTIASIASTIFDFMIGLFPTANPGVTTSINTAVQSYHNIYNAASYWIPVGDIIGVISIMVIVEIAYFTVFTIQKSIKITFFGDRLF
jgi:hypothetical protein